MHYRLSVAGATLPTAPGETLQAALLRQHWDVRMGCRNGACGACRARLVRGAASDRAGKVVTPGPVLPCQLYPRSDLQLDWPSALAPGSPAAARELPCRLLDAVPVVSGWRWHLQLPAGRLPALLTGQYLRRQAERLWIARVDGRDLRVLAPTAPAGERETLWGPFGHCWLDASTPTPLHLLADSGRDLQRRALCEAAAAMDLALVPELDPGPALPAAIMVLSDDPRRRGRRRRRWRSRVALYVDDEGRLHGTSEFALR